MLFPARVAFRLSFRPGQVDRMGFRTTVGQLRD